MKSNGINEKDQKTKTTSSSSSIPVTINYNPPATFPSLAHYWTEWYKQYLNADYPRLIVRFEDLQFHAKEMIDIVCQCAGAVARDNDGGFTYIVSNGKWGSGKFFNFLLFICLYFICLFVCLFAILFCSKGKNNKHDVEKNFFSSHKFLIMVLLFAHTIFSLPIRWLSLLLRQQQLKYNNTKIF